MKKEFIEATERWYREVNKDHHKDRDCHWYVGVEKDYAYGDDAETQCWFVKHNGYIIDEFYQFGESEDEVMKKAVEFIDKEIKKRNL